MGDGERRARRAYINYLYDVDLDKCVLETQKYLNELIKMEDVLYDTWFCYYTLADCYILKKEYDKGILYAKKSKNYGAELSCIMESNWLLASCYKKDDPNYAVEIYNECIAYYKEAESYINMGRAIKNKAEILHDEGMFLEAISIFNNLNIAEYNIKDVKYSLNSAYAALCRLYIKNKQHKKFNQNIKKITDKNAKRQLLKEIGNKTDSNVIMLNVL